MMSKRSEAAIKAWLKCDPTYRNGALDPIKGNLELYAEDGQLIAIFTLRSIIAKRGPKRKAKKVRK